MCFRDELWQGPEMPEEEAAYGKPAQRLMTGFIADADPSWHLEILLIRFDDTKWLAVTKEGNAELLDMSKQRTVQLAWVPGLDGRGRGGQHQWEVARRGPPVALPQFLRRGI